MLALLVGLASHLQARGDEPAGTSPREYEDRFFAAKLAARRCRPDPRPEKKRIDRILIETEDVFGPDDLAELTRIPIAGGLARAGNLLHVETRPYVVAREVLLEAGRPFEKALAEETERNLRAVGIFALARVVACQGSAPGRVDVLVATKDLWSLRVETDFQFSGGLLDSLRIAVIERNLAGRNKQLSGVFTMGRDTFSTTFGLFEPRLLGSRVYVEPVVAAAFGRGGRGLEGGSARLSVGQPLYALSSKWAVDATGDAAFGVTRFFREADFFRCFGSPGTADVTCDNAIDSAAHREELRRMNDQVTPVHRWRTASAAATVTRRFGAATKHDLSFGYGAFHREFELLGDFPSPAFRDAVAMQFLPRSEDATFLFVSYGTFEPRFGAYRNVNKLAVTEDFQLGHDVRLSARWASDLLGSPKSFLELDGSFRYRLDLDRDGFLTFFARGQSRREAAGFVNNRLFLQLAKVSPSLGIGRLILDATAIFRFEDRDNQRSTLGGNRGLRGYANDEFRGRHLVNLHVEYRSLPLSVATVQIGFVAFYDAGHAADEVADLTLRHSVGAGIRVFLPQVTRMTLRLDLGFPLSGGPDDFGRRLAFSFDQAF